MSNLLNNTANAKPIDASAIRITPKNNTAPDTDRPEKGGEGGVPAVSNAEFLAVLFGKLNDDELVAICGKAGDPQQGGWNPASISELAARCPSDRNNYFNCSTFNPTESGTLSAKAANFCRYHLIVLDDVGTKVPLEKVAHVEPTYAIETSPGNFQYGYVLATPITDMGKMTLLQNACADAGLTDNGAKGAARWMRLPNAINGKPKYHDADGKAFRCRLTKWNPDKCFSEEQLFADFNLAPPSPPSVSPLRKHRKSSRHTIEVSHDVFVQKPSENPIVSALKANGLHKRYLGDGRHEITCPWLDEHTDQIDSGTVYFEPTDSYPMGGFRCQHSHGDQQTVKNLLSKFDINEQAATHRSEIRIVPGAIDQVQKAAEFILSETGKVFQSGGAIMFLRKNPSTGDVTTEMGNDATITTALARNAIWTQISKQDKKGSRCDPPVRLVQMLLKANDYTYPPVLNAIARQPYYHPDNGKLILGPGYDQSSGIFGAFEEVPSDISNATREDAQVALKTLTNLLSEFHFESETDRSAAVSAMLTATVRPSLPLAPAFLTTAPDSGVGKSYLNKVIVGFAGGEPARASFPKTSEEATKSVLSLLLTAPAAIEYDDMDTSFMPHGVLNRMLTSETITDRVLGVSKTVTVRTQTFVIASGINVEPERDMLRRVITIRLAARTEDGIGRSFSGNPAEDVRTKRATMIAAVLTIIEAWKNAGQPKSDVASIASYGDDWADYCRHPLIWLGLPDPAQRLFDQVDQDSQGAALGQMLESWYKIFGSKAVTVRQLVRYAFENEDSLFADALQEFPMHDAKGINPSKFGWLLKKQAKRVVGGYRLLEDRADGRKGWRVEKVVKVVTPPSPPLPAPAEVPV
ncbi:hypothetical protein A8B75_15015 [Sphingomonadales bacterium EhC05]|nr:hypothetical protein A8B75_15015 [Sphingomonadales bacterium EhC05]